MSDEIDPLGYRPSNAELESLALRMRKERDELREALEELLKEAERIGEHLSRQGQGATMLGTKCLKARKVLGTKKET